MLIDVHFEVDFFSNYTVQ